MKHAQRTLAPGTSAAGLVALLAICLSAACGGGSSVEMQAPVQLEPQRTLVVGDAAPPEIPQDVQAARLPTSIAAAYVAVLLDTRLEDVGPSSLNASGQVAFTSIGRAMFYDGISVRDIGTLGGFNTAASGLNDAGQITGRSPLADGTQHAFLWTPVSATTGTMLDLGVPPGRSAIGQAINNAGQVAGSLVNGGPLGAVLWTPGVGRVEIGTLPGEIPFSAALMVNASGQVAGVSNLPTGTRASQAFTWTAATGIEPLLSGAVSFPKAINDSGQIVGVLGAAPQSAEHAFLWTRTDGMLDLGTLGGRNSQALGINEAGQVVGGADLAAASSHAFIRNPGGPMTDLGTLGGASSVAVDINNGGLVVGAADAADANTHAFVWSAAEGMVDLASRVAGPTRFDLRNAVAVSDNGSVLVQATEGLVLLKPAGVGGFVTGNVALDLPQRATLNSMVRYPKGPLLPAGHTSFRLKDGAFLFDASSYDWLLVEGNRAQYQGQGALNGLAGYAFRITEVDGGGPGGQGDEVQIRIWHVDPGTSAEVVDFDSGGLVATTRGNIMVR